MEKVSGRSEIVFFCFSLLVQYALVKPKVGGVEGDENLPDEEMYVLWIFLSLSSLCKPYKLLKYCTCSCHQDEVFIVCSILLKNRPEGHTLLGLDLDLDFIETLA